jgi:hypothetical protein
LCPWFPVHSLFNTRGLEICLQRVTTINYRLTGFKIILAYSTRTRTGWSPTRDSCWKSRLTRFWLSLVWMGRINYQNSHPSHLLPRSFLLFCILPAYSMPVMLLERVQMNGSFYYSQIQATDRPQFMRGIPSRPKATEDVTYGCTKLQGCCMCPIRYSCMYAA